MYSLKIAVEEQLIGLKTYLEVKQKYEIINLDNNKEVVDAMIYADTHNFDEFKDYQTQAINCALAKVGDIKAGTLMINVGSKNYEEVEMILDQRANSDIF